MLVNHEAMFIFLCWCYRSGYQLPVILNSGCLLSMQDVTLEHVLKELKKQTGLRFFYSVEKVRSEQKKSGKY